MYFFFFFRTTFLYIFLVQQTIVLHQAFLRQEYAILRDREAAEGEGEVTNWICLSNHIFYHTFDFWSWPYAFQVFSEVAATLDILTQELGQTRVELWPDLNVVSSSQCNKLWSAICNCFCVLSVGRFWFWIYFHFHQTQGVNILYCKLNDYTKPIISR